MKYRNVLSISNLLECGGVESFIYYMAKLYADKYDIAVFYKTGHTAQIARLKKLVRMVRNVGQTIECECLIMNYDIDVIDQVKADKYIQVVHADYVRQGIEPRTDDRITEYYGVSKVVASGWESLTGIPCKVMANPLCLGKPRKVLHLISATRLSREKGAGRMKRLAELLDKAGIAYIWHIYTDARNPFKNPNIITLPTRLDITDAIADADYLVQLSDSEGACYSVIEALALGTPVIVTDLSTFREQGVENGKNGYLLPLDMDGVDVEQIANNIPTFTYKRPACKWHKELVPGQSDYQQSLNKRYLVEALGTYANTTTTDAELKRIPREREQFIVDGARLETLLGDNPYNVPFVNLIKEV